ncbi:MAG: hypothetical protein E7351_00085 [Clostridiales bacterium]|nr:hypothetical protein [Clostridiales bacterium]
MSKCRSWTKRILILMLLLIVVFGLCACSSVNAMTITNTDGTVDEIVMITLDVENAVDYMTLKNDIQSRAIQEAEEIKQDLNNRVIEDLSKTSDEETIEALNSFKEGVSLAKAKWEEDTFTIAIRFKNVDVYKYYYRVEDAKPETKIEESFFYDKVYFYYSTMYVRHNMLYNELYDYYSSEYGDIINSEDSKVMYTYVTDLRREHSDADHITNRNGQYYHTWVLESPNDTITIYYNVANSGNWILVAIGITLVVCLILVTIGVTVSKKRKKDDVV